MLLVQMAVRLLPPDLHAALKAQVKRRFGVARA